MFLSPLPLLTQDILERRSCPPTSAVNVEQRVEQQPAIQTGNKNVNFFLNIYDELEKQ